MTKGNVFSLNIFVLDQIFNIARYLSEVKFPILHKNVDFVTNSKKPGSH